ncbi:TrkA C-terminal domain-containing protein [Gudongella oleilytica]|jgi:K+/H+ antiporter YhaU regulatory subunit KhtT|uniref:TrkA C-terminal domain-containing protein n=1 Tax=Gudongella oleilytica TaxID=1582259 RepID=UPI000EEAB76B|nr:TrkA C-terminal domain-containing protein [Gudongella oleilytica]MDY0257449.1 TrkA C-terminal domain-containing protein [Gudongella oleilytica]HCO18442.1 GntR family transcriptional regulator [Tissierellales bacterium]
MEENYSSPRYEKIALDIANAIYKGTYEEGEKLYGRSTLAGTYNVSPETIRRAVKILEDVGVVESSKGSGITVLSKEKAFKYINRFKNIESVTSYRIKLTEQIEKRQKLEEEILGTIDRIIERSSILSHTTALTPFELEISKECRMIGKSIGEVNFWQNTGATIVGIRRNNETILSPGPYATMEEGDILLIIGEEEIVEAVKIFLEEE